MNIEELIEKLQDIINKNNIDNKYLDIRGACDYLKFGQSKVRELHHRYGLGVKIDGKIIFSKNDLDDFYEKNKKIIRVK